MPSARWPGGNESVQWERKRFGRVRGLTMFEWPASVADRKTTMTRCFRLLLSVALTLTALLAVSAPAGAAQLDLVGSSTSGSASLYPYQQWVDDSYAPTYPGVVQLTVSPALFSCGTVAGAVGCTNFPAWPLAAATAAATPPQVEIDIGYGAYQAHEYEMHELGHVFDAAEMQDPSRAEFMAIWGLPGGASAWWTPFGSEHGSAGEWFAESYRVCALYGPQMPYQAWTTDSAPMASRVTAIRPTRTPPAGSSCRSAPRRASPRRKARRCTRRACSSRGAAKWPNAVAPTCCCSASECGARELAASTSRAVAAAPDPGPRQGGARPRPPDGRERPAGVRAPPSLASRGSTASTRSTAPTRRYRGQHRTLRQ